ncbi:hypothetical protein PYW07_003748 [Mythimna separata]|uniref:Uncharacterized protein n=1 Tax=Mythimna separata TaxID=271217 RepID=A0AAD7YP36_MYTSE|nr:hypothetical protein PYW07_003748 [Mythimna separata]
MKTLVVVSALVALAIAAPALPGEGLDTTDRTQDWHLQAQSGIPDTLKREKKSSDITTSSILNNGVTNSELQNVHIDAGLSTPTGRSFTLKKPLIVKKKHGYHQVYRDSEEEKLHAESGESCGRQVKVKFCNEDKLRTSVTGAHEGFDIHTTEDDVKLSIKMAKEAVENLQRDLKKIEMKTEMKTAHESQSDTELHEDIEVARQALKHIHENFGTLESMSLHSTTTRNSEDMHDVHVTIAKTEEERMAQWKEAMDNIQKNVEIANNIEDSFKTASIQDSMLNLDQSEAATTIADKTEENIHLHSALDTHKEREAAEEIILNKDINENLSEHNVEDDMKTAPSEMIEVHLDHIKNQAPLISENQKIHEQEKSAEVKIEDHNLLTENKDLLNKENIVHHHHPEKRSDIDMDMLTDQSEHHIMQVPLMRAVDEDTETKMDVEKITTFKTSENIPLAPISTSTIMKPLALGDFSEHQKSADETTLGDKIEHNLEQEKRADDGMIDFLAKSADLVPQDKRQKEELHKDHLLERAKAAENLKLEHGEHLTENWEMKPKEAVEIKQFDSIPKSTEQVQHSHIHKMGEHNQNIMLAKSVDHTSILDHQKQQMMHHEESSPVEITPEMKAAEEHLHHLQHVHNAHWAHEHRQLDHLSSMKAAEDIENEFRMAHGQAHGHGIMSEHTMDHLRNSHFAGHGQIPSKMGMSHNIDMGSHISSHAHQPSRYHHNSMHSQMHDMNGMGMHSNFRPNMRDAMEGLGSEHMFRWKPAQESARVAYGSGLGYGSGLSGSAGTIGSTIGSGAVGVFPNANIGGCSIPLLLSCSPSVVSGSLAKAHAAGPSSYSAPSYRAEEEFGFHNKRDVKKASDIRTTNVLRSPTIYNQKSSTTQEKTI